MIYAIAGIFAMLFYLWQITVLVMPEKSFDSWNEWIHSLFLRNLFETASWLMLSISLLLYFMTEKKFFKRCAAAFFSLFGLGMRGLSDMAHVKK